MESIARAIVTVVGLALGAVALLWIGPTAPDVDEYREQTASILMLSDLNEGTADSAPQQQVVNGWVARDLLAAQSEQFTASIEQQARTNQLLFVGLLVALGALWTSRRSAPDQPERSASDISPDADAPASGSAVPPPAPALGPPTAV